MANGRRKRAQARRQDIRAASAGRGRTRPVMTIISAVLLAAIVSSFFVMAGVQPASAGVYAIFPANGNEDLTDEFTTTDALMAYVQVDIQGGRICVVHEDDREASCDDAPWGGANSVLGIGTLVTIVASPPLEEGT